MRIRMLLGVNGQAGSLGYKYQAKKQRRSTGRKVCLTASNSARQYYATAYTCKGGETYFIACLQRQTTAFLPLPLSSVMEHTASYIEFIC
jgi:hypothetical protein